MQLMEAWLADAFARRTEHGDLPDPTAAVLSTVELPAQGGFAGVASSPARPRSRTVLLKGHDASGFVFYTNKHSAKGRQLAHDPWASLVLPWYPLQRQVRIDGRVEEVADEEADRYFASRPRPSQIGAWASQQSEEIGSRADLDAAYAQAQSRFEGGAVPRPPHWGGYRLVPDRMEFWQGRPSRLHDRILYERTAGPGGGAWSRTRLQP